jgi:hypothetical protein
LKPSGRAREHQAEPSAMSSVMEAVPVWDPGGRSFLQSADTCRGSCRPIARARRHGRSPPGPAMPYAITPTKIRPTGDSRRRSSVPRRPIVSAERGHLRDSHRVSRSRDAVRDHADQDPSHGGQTSAQRRPIVSAERVHLRDSHRPIARAGHADAVCDRDDQDPSTGDRRRRSGGRSFLQSADTCVTLTGRSREHDVTTEICQVADAARERRSRSRPTGTDFDAAAAGSKPEMHWSDSAGSEASRARRSMMRSPRWGQRRDSMP